MAEKNYRRRALVTGANRGIGLEVAKQLATSGMEVIATTRNANNLVSMREALAENGDCFAYTMDVTCAEEVQAVHRRVEAERGPVDILINNAGVALDQWVGALQVDARILHTTLEVNLLGVVLCCQTFVPGMIERGWGRVINVSTELASISEMTMGSTTAYRCSKAAVNAYTRLLALELGDASPVRVNAACPGWVRTALGGPDALYSVEEGADTIVWLATQESPGPQGGNFRQRQSYPW